MKNTNYILIIFTLTFVIIFLFSCHKDDQKPPSGKIVYGSLESAFYQAGGGVSDVEGNVYKTVIIGSYEWMAENLKVTKDRNGISLPKAISNEEWQDYTHNEISAYSIYPYSNISGINSEEDMKEKYGLIYNWFAVDNDHICPDGWRVPTVNEWESLIDYLVTNFEIITSENYHKVLMSCRQVDSPLQGDCNTNEHPRWSKNDDHYGTDDFGFSAFPGGSRSYYNFSNVNSFASSGKWWASREDEFWPKSWVTYHSGGAINIWGDSSPLERKGYGFSIRCLRDL